MTIHLSLANLGWQPFYQQQLSLDEWETAIPARVIEQHKSEIEVATEAGAQTLSLTYSMPPLTVGDWVLLDAERFFLRALERHSCFRRKAAGSKVSEQLIAANVDTAFIVCSLNDDFNLNRIERYLSIVNNANAEPVVVLSKMDLCPEPVNLSSMVQGLDSLLCVETVNCLSADSVSALLPWCQSGKTVVLLGSSGAGKSALTNTLLGSNQQLTGTIRENDAKGRHTTTRRSLLTMPDGAMILDTPGMRELQLADCEEGVATTFSDVEDLARNCRFGDCQHENEPDCAVRKAIDSGELDERRFLNYCKLSREQALNGASLAQRRASDRQLGRYYKRVQRASQEAKRG
ncbi:MAG: ribosome small subunit-dependent GTPase A [Pseudomonadales bacterium]